MCAMPIYRLKITLKDVRPPIWRRVLVERDISLDDLHNIIQAVMPWDDAHLYAFQKGRTLYGLPDPDGDWELIQYDSRDIALADVLKKPKDSIIYQYDFGDDWRHEVRLEKTLPLNPEAYYPACIAGKRACPPEDVGGPWGYAEMLQALKDPKHPQYELYVDWIGDDFDPEAFDLEEANLALLDLEGDDELPMLPVNRHIVIMTPTPGLADFLATKISFSGENGNNVLSPLAFLAPMTDSEEALDSLLEGMKPILIVFHLIATGVFVDTIEDIWQEVLESFTFTIYPLVFDLDYETPLVHVTSDMMDEIFDQDFDEDV